MSTEQCNRCRFWKEDERANDTREENWGFGHCRRDAPVIVQPLFMTLLPQPTYGRQVDPEIDITSLVTASSFPATFATDWCGKFRPEAGGAL